MEQHSAHLLTFLEEVKHGERVYVLESRISNSLITVSRSHERDRVGLFFSDSLRAELWMSGKNCEVKMFSLSSWVDKVLPRLQADAVLVGLNWDEGNHVYSPDFIQNSFTSYEIYQR
jgi:Protein of unknown function (DUF2750)